MRTITAAELNALKLPHRKTTMRVKVDRDGLGTMQDLTKLGEQEFDFVQSASFGNNVDTPVETLQVMLWREVEKLSLSPFLTSSKFNIVAGSFVPMIFVDRQITVETAVTGLDITPADGDFNLVFDGFIDEVDPGGTAPAVVLRCRDKGSLLMDTFIEVQRTYGSTFPGIAVETVMQSILDDNFGVDVIKLFSVNGTGGTPFNPADSPGFNIASEAGGYIQQKEPVLEALRKIVQQFGFEVKYRFHDNTSEFQLVLFSANREKASRGTLSVSGPLDIVEDVDFFDIGSTKISAVSATPITDQFNVVAGDTIATAKNIVFAVNNGTAATGSIAFAFRLQGTPNIVFEAAVRGTAGNSITFTESLTDSTMDGAGTLGGTQTGAGPPATVFTFGPDSYYQISPVKISRLGVRNRVKIIYDDLDTEVRTSIIREDLASQAKFGKRFMEAAEESQSQIDTSEEASDFASAILEDLKDPELEQSVEVDYFWPLRLGDDRLLFEANDIHYGTDQDLGVVSVGHTLTRDKARTVLGCRGNLSGGFRRWLAIEGRSGIAPANDKSEPIKPTGSATANVGSIIITYDEPTEFEEGFNWATTEVYLDTSAIDDPLTDPDGTPLRPSAGLLVASGKQTEFVINDLAPGVTFFIRLVVVDNAGNISLVSDQITQATQRVGPFHENTDGFQDLLLRNSDFNIFTLDPATNPPDFWTVVQGTYGSSDEVFFSTLNAQTGDKAITMERVSAGVPSIIECDFIPFQDDDVIQIGVHWKKDAGADQVAFMNILFFDQSKSLISTLARVFPIKVAGFTSALGFESDVPATTRFVKMQIEAEEVQTFFIDRASLLRAKAVGENVLAGGAPSFPVGTTQFLDLGTTIQLAGITLDTSTGLDHKYIIKSPGAYAVNFTGGFSRPSANGPFDATIDITSNGASIVSEATSSIGAPAAGPEFTTVSLNTGIVFFDRDDEIQLQGLVESASAVVLSETGTMLIRQITRIEE